MKILYCKNNFAGPVSGADEITVNYAIELKAAGHSTSVLLVHNPSKNDTLSSRLREAGVPLSALASPTFTVSLAAGRDLAIRAMRAFSPGRLLIRTYSRKIVFHLLQRYHDACCEYLRKHQPDVVHVMTPDPGAVMFIRAAHAVGIPVVYQEVGIPYHPPGFEEVYERFATVLPLCSEVAVLSPNLAREMRRAVPQLRRPWVVPLISEDVRNGKLETSPPSGSVSFGFAARLEHLKGPLPLVEAFNLVARENPAVTLKIAGDGSQRGQIELRLRRLGLEKRCKLTGTYSTLEERGQFMRTIDVFILPSLTEGTPNAIIEAMAHGKPVVGTNVGGIPDLVTADVGFLVSPGDVTALGAAMSRLASDGDLRRKMGVAARKRYEQLFMSSAVLPLISDFYQRVVAAHNSPNGEQVLPLTEVGHPWANVETSPRHTAPAPPIQRRSFDRSAL